MIDVSILVISYNTRDLTLACLRSVLAQTHGVEYEVLVVDNASTDGSAAAVARQFPKVRLTTLRQNVGFARANNAAARQANGEFLLLLNPDTVILDGAVQRAVAFARARPEFGVVGGRTFFEDMTLNFASCHGRPTPWSLLCMGTGLSSVFRQSRLMDPESLGAWRRDRVREVDAVSGCFLLMRRRLWEQLGGFDESFFMYGEDTDLCIRARQLGQRCAICPDARLIHYGGRSERVRADKMVRLFRAKRQLFDKHWGRRAARFGGAMLALWALTRTAACGLLASCSVGGDARREAFEAWHAVWRRRGEYAGLGARPEAVRTDWAGGPNAMGTNPRPKNPARF